MRQCDPTPNDLSSSYARGTTGLDCWLINGVACGTSVTNQRAWAEATYQDLLGVEGQQRVAGR